MTDQISKWRNYFSDNISTEFRLLINLLEYNRNSYLSRPDDFSIERFIKLLSRHRIRPFILEYLDDLKQILSDKEVDYLKKICQPYVIQQMKLTQVKFQVIEKFNTSRIKVIPFKGPLLSKKLYGSYTIRESIDLDLLIQSSDLIPADRVLRKDGFTSEFDIRYLKDWNLRWFQRKAPDICYYRNSDKVKIELHWKLFEQPYLINNSHEHVFDQSVLKSLPTLEFNELNVVDEFYYLIVHGNKHSWFRIKWLLDIKQIITTNESLNWLVISNLFKKKNKYHLLLSSLYIVSIVFNVPMPTAIDSNYKLNDKSTYSLVEESMKNIIDENLIADPNTRLKIFKRLDYNFKGLIAFLTNSLVDQKDIFRFRLPNYLFWLYFIIRPFTYLYKKLSSNTR